MRFCVETEDGEVLEVTTLFDAQGKETDDLDETVSCVVKFGETSWGAYPLNKLMISRVQ